jgi:DNA polymerase I-like protein with 3'-5' exonuclease and polymerase domains/uracil-DNA glycosylase
MTTVGQTEKCQGCPLAKLRPEAEFVPPTMGPSLRILIGPAPYVNKDAKTLNKFGSDKMFDSLASKVGIRTEELSVVQCFNCIQPDNVLPIHDKTIPAKEAQAAKQHCYKAYVEPIINSRPWSRIDTLGSVATTALTGEYIGGITKWRGSPLKVLGETKPRVMPLVLPNCENKHEPTLIKDYTQIPMFISDLKKGLVPPPEYYNLHPDLDSLEAFCNAEQLCFDIETNGFTKQITMVGISTKPYYATVVPFNGNYIGMLKRIFASAKSVIGQNIVAFDLPVLEVAGVKTNETCQVWDIMLMQHLLQPDLAHDLETISSLFTQKPAWKHLSNENMALYCARDVDSTLQSFRQLKPYCDYQKLTSLYQLVQVPLTKICKGMSDYGIKRDVNRIKVLRDKYLEELKIAEAKLPEPLRPCYKAIRRREPAPPGTVGKSGKPVKFITVPDTEYVVPYNSPKRVAEYLYGTLGLPEQLHAKRKNVTTDKTALDRLWRKTHNPVLKDLMEVARLEQLLSTFLKDESSEIAVQRIHANFLPHGTVTGRLSSSNPNMQNIPPASKFTYVPSHAGWCFVEVDFSSLENRLAAWYASDMDRLKRLNTAGFNEHKWLAGHIFGIPMEEVDKKSYEYGIGKHSNHGCDAGMGARKMSVQYDVPEKDAAKYIAMWKKLNKASADWQERVGKEAGSAGVLSTVFGRKRWFWSYSSYTDGIRFMTQSTGADICYRAMISLMYERIKWPVEKVLALGIGLHPLPQPAQLVLQVHDSLLFECPENMTQAVVDIAKQACEQYWPELGGMNIPIAYKIGVANSSWGELNEG